MFDSIYQWNDSMARIVPQCTMHIAHTRSLHDQMIIHVLNAGWLNAVDGLQLAHGNWG